MAKLKVTAENENGRNTKFQDTSTGATMSRTQAVKAIEAGKYPGYHVRNVHGVKTPVSNPDGKSRNNLG